ncbi:MAG: GTPase Obg [Candidatus Argoarchaeum ethanivorans]|uniref:GTPase Obg n=1 Tax=Candidatus Argoarchaeum ethanivorans TaxID=2608793 RepID=A0A811T2C2_9EURY|nr:MAG: GTPase Obg [Candidatus Argoarchaeum ethanivorans]
MIFEKIRTVPRSNELLDKAFRRGSRAKNGKISYNTKREAEASMIMTAGNILSDNLANVVRDFPSFNEISPFYNELADVIVGVDKIRVSLSSIQWASKKIKEISRSNISKIYHKEDPKLTRQSAIGRMSSVVNRISKDLEFLDETRNKLRKLPDIRDEPTIVVAGYPNVGKSSFVKIVSSANPEIATYPFTTKGLLVGHFARDGTRYQIVDTPGLFDRPLKERNTIERQAILALAHQCNIILFIFDPSETCGYVLEEQQKLQEELVNTFSAPIVTVYNKKDMVQKNYPLSMSTLTKEGTDAILELLIEKIS